MARSFLTPINLNSLELQNFVVHNINADPTSVTGRLYYNTSSNVLKYYNGSAWQTIATGGSAFYIGTQQVLIGNSSGDVTALPGVTSVNGTTIPSSATLLTSTSTSSSLTSVGTLTSLTMGGNISLQSTTGSDGYKITGLKDPSSALDAVNKQYVDGIASGINAHDAVAYATTAALGTTGNLVGGTITTTYNNNTTGVGATLTIATSTNWTEIKIDGQTVTVGDRVLIKDQGTALQNGIYTVTTAGAVGNTTSFVFTRATDNDQIPELGQGDLTYVLAGTKNGGNGFVQTSVVTTVGTSSITWSQFSGSSTILAGSGLVTNGTNPNQLDVNTGTGITVNGSDQVIIDTAWAGQTAITTLGTIGTGVWQGTAIAGQYGGTGVNNSGKTITLGGNLTTSGAFATTLTVTATTSVTLPTSGTLMDNKMTTIGDILYASATGTPATYTRLAGNTATQPSFLSSTGNGSANTTTAFTSSTGSGNVVLATSPTITTPTIATITAPTSAPLALKSADSSSLGSPTSAVSLKSGDQSSATSNAGNNSGSVTIDAGTAGTGGTVGSVLIGTTNATTVTIGKTSGTTTNIRGTVQLDSKTVSLAGNLTTTGAFNTTFAQGATVTLTLPTANGTLATLAGSEALTNKTYNGLTISTTTGTLTMTNGKVFSVSNTMTLSSSGDGNNLNIGTGGTLGSAAFTASTAYVSSTVMTTLGDILYGGASGAATRLAGETTTTRKFLRSVGVSSAATAPAWDTIQAGDIPTLNQNTTGSAGSVTNSLVIKSDSGTTEGTDLYTFNGSAAKTINFVSGTGVTLAETSGTITFNNSGVTSVNGSTGAIGSSTAQSNGNLTRYYRTTNSAGTTTTINHAYGQWVLVQVYKTSDGTIADVDITNTATNSGTTTIGFAASQTAGDYTIVIIG